MKILVTGGAGYVGCELLPMLNGLPDVESIVVYDNLSRRELNFFFGSKLLQKVTFVNGDILDSVKLSVALKDVDTVIHLAAFVSHPFNHLQNLQYEQVNRWGTLSLVRCVQQSESVKRFLYMSSAAVYGFREDISKNDEAQPGNAYGLSKLNGEGYVELLRNEMDVAIIRAGNIFGFNTCMGLDGVLNVFFFDSLVKGEIKIYGNGQQKRPFVAIITVVNKIIDCLNGQKSELMLSVEFNSTMNELKDWLLNQQENLNYQYLNQNQVFPGQSFLLDTIANRESLLMEAYEKFKKNIRVRR